MRCANQLDWLDWVSDVCMLLSVETALGRPDSLVGRDDYTLNREDTHTHTHTCIHVSSYVEGKKMKRK